jgi:hypothetical protein
MDAKQLENLRESRTQSIVAGALMDSGIGMGAELQNSATLPGDDLVNGNWQLVAGGDAGNPEDWVYMEWWTVGSPVGSAPIKPI